MAITFRCEHCRKSVNAPDSAAGQRGKCPYCGNTSYIPLPKSELEDEIPLAPEDEEEERERREQIKRLLHHDPVVIKDEGGGQPPTPLEHKPDLRAEDLHHLVVNYCSDMFQGNLDRAGLHVKEMKKFKYTAVSAVEDFQTGRVTEKVLANIPKKVLEAFLSNLKEQLKA